MAVSGHPGKARLPDSRGARFPPLICSGSRSRKGAGIEKIQESIFFLLWILERSPLLHTAVLLEGTLKSTRACRMGFRIPEKTARYAFAASGRFAVSMDVF